MLLSMTGYGEAIVQNELAFCRVEIRSVNNRHFKLALRCPDGFLQHESDFERLLRESISRGSVHLSVKIDQIGDIQGPRLNSQLLKTYWRQLNEVCQELSVAAPEPAQLLNLPGVLREDSYDSDTVERLWPLVEQAVTAAATHLQEFRRKEGSTTASELAQLLERIEEVLGQVVEMAPQVARDYHEKLVQRTRELLAGTDVNIEPSDVLREVALYADRCDIHEEITRLRSHMSQFRSLIDTGTSPGRKLDFLCQEMFREVNTIGSKANHIGLSHSAVDLKSSIERIREIVQNVE
ncbi:YicC/YloC family endoribonuclease [Schlesneria sp. T3-172]|uniref:YicC/YloC family endoribonuclease n=1 Tax=Schlesneria sphaerica TaxID=3373610 RepID=UPI0037C632A0